MKMLSVLKRFAGDERGAALVFVTMTLPVLVGFSLLAIDMSRVNNLHNDLQKAADAFALAGAAELDGSLGAINRATGAITNLLTNDSRFSTAGTHTLALADLTVTFLDEIPPSDATTLTAAGLGGDGQDYSTTLDADARFVEVTVNPTGFATIFPASFLGATNTLTVGAQAVAGFGSAVCNFTPLFMCNPYEAFSGWTPDVTLAEAVAGPQYRRRLIELRSVGGTSDYFPGNFGFLDAAGANGARALAEMIASSQPLACFSSGGVDTKTGQNSGPVKGALNIRFGISEPGANYNGAQYGPAQNVRKGAQPPNGNSNNCPNGNQVTYPPDPASGIMGLPTDPCFALQNCTLMGGRMGDGDWNFATYWSVNHPNRPVPIELSGTGVNQPTRYKVYRYEVDTGIFSDVSTGGETGVPKSGCGTPVTSVDRRLIYGAIINCRALEAQGYNLSGAEDDLPVEAFASFFITEPIKKIPQTEYDASIFVELVDVTGSYGAGTLENFQRDEAQLYR